MKLNENKYKVSVIKKEVDRLRKEYPEAIYNSNPCSYSKGNVKNGPKTKGCLIGQAIRNVYPDLFNDIKKNNDSYEIESLINSIDCITGSDRDIERLSKIQMNQDCGVMWGKC